MLSLICSTTSTRFQYEIYDSINEVVFSWNNFLPKTHPLQSQNLEILERTQPEDIQFKYLLVKENEDLVGVVYLQEIKFNSKHYDVTAFSSNSFLKLFRPFILNQKADLLICGNLFRMNFTGFHFAEHLENETIGQVLSDYIEIRKSKKKFAGVFLKDVAEKLRLKEVSNIHFKPFPDDLTMEMPIDSSWNSIEDYAKALSKKYRQRLKKIQNSAQDLVRKELNFDEIEQFAPQLFALYNQVVERQFIRIGTVNAQYFVEMKRILDDDFKVVGYFKDNELVAFASYIFYNNQTFEIHYIGIDYAYNEQHQLYLNILNDGLAMGIESEQKSVELGRTARLAKASLGAKPILLNSYYAMRLGLPALVFAVLNYFFGNKMGEDWKVRNPFR